MTLGVRVALKLRSLGLHPPRLCRLAVFSIQTYVALRLGQGVFSPIACHTAALRCHSCPDLYCVRKHVVTMPAAPRHAPPMRWHDGRIEASGGL